MRTVALLIVVFAAMAFAQQSTDPVSTPLPAVSGMAVSELAAFIDTETAAARTAEGLKAAAPADDATWLRRLSLDLCGTIPRREEVTEFLAARNRDKRERKIEEYFTSANYAAHQAQLWTKWLLQDGGRNGERMEGTLEPWLLEQFATRVNFATIVREMITASGVVEGANPGGFVLTYHDSVETLTGVTAKVLLGLQIQCAQCHDHPSDHWKQVEFNRFAAFFSGVRGNYVPRKGMGGPVVYKLEDRGLSAELLASLIRLNRRAGSAMSKAKGGRGEAPMQEGDPAAEAPSGERPMGSMESMTSSMGAAAAEGSAWTEAQTAAFNELADHCRSIADGVDPLAPLEVDAKAFENLRERLPSDARLLVDDYGERRDKFGLAAFLGGKASEVDGKSRRAALAGWITDPANPWFAQAIVNRLWSELLGRGFVEPIDDLSAATNRILPNVLSTLAREFVASGTDMRHLIGAMVRTSAYAAGNSETAEVVEREREERWFAAHPIRSQTASQLTDSLLRARGDVDATVGDRHQVRVREELFADLQRSYGREVPGARENWIARIPQALLLMNNKAPVSSTPRWRGRLHREFIDAAKSRVERLNGIYLSLLGRSPDAAEADALFERLDAAQRSGPKAFEDVVWALLNTTEFRANR